MQILVDYQQFCVVLPYIQLQKTDKDSERSSQICLDNIFGALFYGKSAIVVW